MSLGMGGVESCNASNTPNLFHDRSEPTIRRARRGIASSDDARRRRMYFSDQTAPMHEFETMIEGFRQSAGTLLVCGIVFLGDKCHLWWDNAIGENHEAKVSVCGWRWWGLFDVGAGLFA